MVRFKAYGMRDRPRRRDAHGNLIKIKYDYQTDDKLLRTIIDINRFKSLEGEVSRDLLDRSLYCSKETIEKTIEENRYFLKEVHGIEIN